MAVFDPNYPVFSFNFRRYAPFAKFGQIGPGIGYAAGDNRGVSTSLKATSRTYGIVFFNRLGVIDMVSGSSGTHFYPFLGAVAGGASFGTASVTKTLVKRTGAGNGKFGFRASTAAGMPLFPGTPDIDTFVDVSVDFSMQNILRVSGEAFGDNFPNLEVFVLCFRSKRTALVLDGQTTGGPQTGPVTRLYTSHEWFSLGKYSANLPLNNKGEMIFNISVAETSMGNYLPFP